LGWGGREGIKTRRVRRREKRRGKSKKSPPKKWGKNTIEGGPRDGQALLSGRELKSGLGGSDSSKIKGCHTLESGSNREGRGTMVKRTLVR